MTPVAAAAETPPEGGRRELTRQQLYEMVWAEPLSKGEVPIFLFPSETDANQRALSISFEQGHHPHRRRRAGRCIEQLAPLALKASMPAPIAVPRPTATANITAFPGSLGSIR